MTTRRKQHTTLSDLLADDVRDYFLREGVPNSPPRPSRPEGGGHSRRRSGRFNRDTEMKVNNSTPQRVWRSLPPSEMTHHSPLRMENFDQDDAIIEEKHSTSSELSNDIQTQQRGQNTAESHARKHSNGSHSRNSSNGSRQMQQHRRHGSGSGSFNSRGSSSSRFKRVSAADAEFLRRYAEERERTNLRMNAATPHLNYLPTAGNLSPPRLTISSNVSIRPHHGFSVSPRPPTVTGSHRPGLPSIDNDDWEEDDRIEYKDRLKQKRREARMRDRHRRKQSSIDGSISGSSFVRQATGGNVNDTMEYSVSTSSGSQFMANSPIQSKSPEQGNNKKQTRHVRPLSYLSASSESGGEAGEASQEESRGNDAYFSRPPPPERDSSYGSIPRGNDSPHTHGHDSYVSGNNSYSNYRLPSGNDSYYSRQTSLATPDFMFTPSPVHSYAVAVAKFMGSDTSTLHSSLRGSSIYSAASSRERSDETDYTTTESSGVGRNWRSPQERDEESSEGSYDSYDSDSSSYTSDSYYESHSESHDESSSSSSSNQWERVANARRDYRDTNTGRQVYRDIENGGNGRRDERQMLLNKGNSNYSSLNTHEDTKSRRKNRDQKQRRKQRQEKKLRGPPLRLDDAFGMIWKKILSFLVMLELLISNMPSLIGSLALAWGSLGIDWFKWYEENASDCIPTEYHNEACVFPEFPGCFACDTSRTGYLIALNFHYFCSAFSFVLASFLIGKILIAFPVVRDELANPTTAAPLGLLCMALDKCFAGNFGFFGKAITFMSASTQLVVAIWFIFISVVYKTLPEPSWFPNTIGIGLAAVKMFLYWSMGGYILSGVSIVTFFMFYFVALYRLHTNEKISAVVCWLQLSGPAVVLYGYSIFSQAGSDEEELLLLNPEFKARFFQDHREYYMPLNHLLFAVCLISMASALYCLKTRWASFRSKEFSPAHVGFCAPLASHANAIQAYRAALNKFSLSPPNTLYKEFIYRYWCLSLICGTVLSVILTFKFLKHLPLWCQIDVEDDEIPPPPDETILTRLLQKGEAADAMNQNFVSAAVLQANESGALVRVLRDGRMKYVRSRRMPSMGFDPIMNTSEFMSERDRLIQHISYAAKPTLDRGGMTSFDDAIRDFQEPDRLRASSRRNKLNFMSFDASTLMRGSFSSNV